MFLLWCGNGKFNSPFPQLSVIPLWDIVKNLLNLNDITLEQIILNNINQNFKAVDNCIVLITKYYIYRTRCLNEKLNVQACKKFIKDFHDIEEYQARLNDKLNLHIAKWSLIELKWITQHNCTFLDKNHLDNVNCKRNKWKTFFQKTKKK